MFRIAPNAAFEPILLLFIGPVDTFGRSLIAGPDPSGEDDAEAENAAEEEDERSSASARSSGGTHHTGPDGPRRR